MCVAARQFSVLLLLLVAQGTHSSLAASDAPAPEAYGGTVIVLMISDGCGFNAFDACSYFEFGVLGEQVYDAFPVRMACTTYMLNDDGQPQGYDVGRMWKNFNYAKGHNDYTAFTDSAAAATALYTGSKTTYGRVSTDRLGRDLRTIAEMADERGWSTGVVTTVPISHATPACVAAHDESRSHYSAIANQMIYASGLDVIMGAGHPFFNDDGQLTKPREGSYDYVGGRDVWRELVQHRAGNWTLIQQRQQFEDIANDPDLSPERLVGIAQVHTTLQYRRHGRHMGDRNPDVPDLATMTRAALNVLSRNPGGFFLMVEGGAVDWANHDNNLARMIEEQMDFNRAAEAAAAWIEERSGWDKALMIVTADHECGMLWGAGAYTDNDSDGFFDPEFDDFNGWRVVRGAGAGALPLAQYASNGHTNTLVPLFAAGLGSEWFASNVRGHDPFAGGFWGFSGAFIDNTAVFQVMKHVVVGECRGDLDDDSDTDQADLAILLSAWNRTAEGDLDDDGDTDQADLAILLSDYGCGR